MSDFTVSLELPEVCDPGDFPGGATPLEAVEAFVASVVGSPDLWAYVVRENGGQRRAWRVDMADGPSITPIDREL